MIAFKALDRPEEWAWVKRVVRAIICEDSQGIVAYDAENGQIRGVCVADSFGIDSCNVHIGIERPFKQLKQFLAEISRHLFCVCGRERIFGLVPGDNDRALRFDRKIGFKEVARVPNGYGTGIDYIILGMEKAECPWLPQEVREAA